ncbi:hypothetical protein H4696_004978 [Amycolatopsis lexingtonensis]|uniref:Uncharacterized protein n=1 Tax=Amycolatopsis lexingtonensis TaxID=218822 RepID=A0ABR9I3R5_9PSEU|nr:hypothetical protein [Amycolatopsis lexingtonensis]MBE1497878.1 hypothetical protein [Amycolatopsis lexingtonensis]
MTALSDDFPVLLAPVRVETRFTPTELLVRVFPDEWAVDKSEPKPADAEIAALDAYWTARWAAGGREAPLRAAWQELAARVPPGRADWLLRTRVPANPADEPAGVAAGTVVLVIRTATAVAANDRAPSVAYWTAVWRAHGDRTLLRQADAALDNAVKNAGRAAGIRARRPAGVDAAAATPPPANSTPEPVVVAFLVLPAPATGTVATAAWTQGARARLLPDKFQVLGFTGGRQVVSVTGAAVPATLAVSPDPAAVDQISVNEQTGVLHVPDDLRWLVDFDRAVAVGMGMRIPLTDEIRDGLERLVVLGLREQATPAQSATALADLITRQLRGPDGFSLLPQGTPTNNSEAADAGRPAEAEADSVRAGTAAPAAAAADWTTRTDGQQLADLLGIGTGVLAGMPNANSTDVRDARAANTALWPATWGYFLQTALHPLLGPAAVTATRDFFLKYVSGRGPLPAVKIGRQPYGILPTTAFSRLAFPATATHRRALNRVLTEAGLDWATAAEQVPHLGGAADDAHQHLLDLLALHPTSAEHHQRYAQSVEDLFNRENLGGLGATVPSTVEALGLPGPVRELLGRFGAGQDPDLLRRLFTDFQQPLLAPLVDDRPLSETDPIRPYTTDGRDYLSWLAGLARTDLNGIRLESGFAEDARPAALLYLLLRHALLLGWDDAARALTAAAGVPAGPPVDPPFIHVRLPGPDEDPASESRFRLLYSPNPPVTGHADQLLVDFIPGALSSSGPTAALDEQARSLDVLKTLPTAKLERVLAEHLDLATYRLDAWRLGLANERLTELRFAPDGTAKPGLHLGAYGFLENVRPHAANLEPVTLSGPLATVFAGTKPLLHDPENKGFAHAPSLSHARTAAVLRAGHVANETPGNADPFAVDLSSARVRVALSILDGMRQGQSLGALLGYRFERGLHDRDAEAEVDEFIAGLRLKFPLRAAKIPQTAGAAPDEIGQVEARNVVDGLALARHLSRNDVSRRYPFDLDGLPEASPAQAQAIGEEAERLLDANDAVADLAVAEATHQALGGNPERASATLDAYAKDGLPPDPAVIRTPRGGTTLTHRFGLRLRTGLHPNGGASPRAKAEPAVDDWLPSLFPPARSVAAVVRWTDPVNGHERREEITQDDLDLSPIDLLWLVRPVGDASRTDLDDRIIGAVVDRFHPRPDAVPSIRYTERSADDDTITFFELSPLIAALRTLLTTARPLTPTDLVPPAGPVTVDRSLDDTISVSRQRPDAVRDALDDLADDVADYIRDLERLYPPAPAVPRRHDIAEDIDTLLTRYGGLATTAGGFGMLRSGWGELTAWRRGVFTGVLADVAATADRLARALTEADTLLALYDLLPNTTPDAERFRQLRAAERLLRTTPDPDPPDRPSGFRGDLRRARNDLAGRIDDLREVAGTSRTTLSGLLDEVGDLLPLSDVDPVGLDLNPVLDQVVAFGAELLSRARALAAEVAARMTASAAALAEADAARTDPDEARATLDALRALLGEDVLVVPEYTLPDDLGDGLHDAFDDSDDLVRHLTQAPVLRDFPVDDWLHGVARVREMPRLWERVVLLSDALRDRDGLLGDDPGDDGPVLHPVQLPFRADDHWLAMELAAGATVDEDRLLFTAHYADEPSRGDGPSCGLLFDEWTEVLPADRETTGIAVHADSPDSEPPQSMLLVVPPVRTGTWQTADLVAAVTETFDLARTRLVEPAQLDGTGYAQLLPATVLSATRRPITISTDLATATTRWKADHD